MLLNFLKNFLKEMLFPNRSGYSVKSFWGGIKHYNKNGVQIGYSLITFWRGRERYDMNGKLISYSLRNFWGGYDTYDANGNLIRKSYRNFWGGYTTYNRAGKKSMESYQSFWCGMNHFDVEDSNSEETFVYVKHDKTRKTWDVSARSVSEKSVRNTPNPNYNLYGVKNEQVRTIRAQAENRQGNKSDVTIKSNSASNRDNRYVSASGIRWTTNHSESKHNAKADLSKLFQQHIDKSIPFYESLSELGEEQNENGVKILAFAYDNLKEFPAYVHEAGDKLKVSPLIRNVQSFTIDKSEISGASKKLVGGLKMDTVDSEFLSFSASKIVNEFDDLFPEYEYKVDGMARVQYEFKCGLIITENSWLKMKEVFCE